MLKKSAAILLVVLYTVTASGFALNLHYCFNQLASVQIDAPAKNCGMDAEARKMSCCKDKHLVVKVKDAHQNASSLFLGKVFAVTLPSLGYPDFTVINQGDASITQPAYRGPPVSPPVPAYVLNRNIRI